VSAARPRVLLLKIPCASDAAAPPLGLGYLAATVSDLAEVRILEGIRQPMDPQTFRHVVASWRPDVVGFSVNTHAAPNLAAYARAAEAGHPAGLRVAGGAHPTALPAETLASAPLHCVLRGEAELPFRQLVRLVVGGNGTLPGPAALATVPGAAFADGDGVTEVAVELVDDIDRFGIPAWHLMPPADYPHAPHGAFAQHYPVAPILTSRGCPYSCGFCSVPQLVTQKIRYRSPELIADELRLLRNRFGIREFQIVDDNFTIDRRRAIAICEHIVAEGLVMPWSCPNGVRVDALDDELLDAMRAAGCYSISLGLESGSPAVLARMVKHLDLDIVPAVVDRIVARGMEAHAFFILGYPGETEADVDATIRLARSLPLTRANFSLFTPLPGTPEYDRLSAGQRDRILNLGDFAEVSYVAPGLTVETLKAQQRRAFMSFYGRPRQLGRLALAVRTPGAGYHLARRAAHWLRAY